MGQVWSKNSCCPLFFFLLFRMVPSWALRRWALNMTQLSWTSCLSRAMSYGILLSSSRRLKSAIQKSRATCCPAPSSQSPELHHLMALQPRLTLTYLVQSSSSLSVSGPGNHLSLLAPWLLVPETSSGYSRSFLDCLCPAVLFHQLLCGSPMRTRAYEHEASEGLTYYFFLIRRSIADTHYKSTHIRLPIPGPFQGKSYQKSIYKFL